MELFKKCLSAAFIFLLLLSSLKSQNIDFIFSDPVKLDNQERLIGLLDIRNDTLFSLSSLSFKNKPATYNLIMHNATNLNFTGSHQLPQENANGEKFNHQYFVTTSNRLFSFCTSNHSQLQKSTLFAVDIFDSEKVIEIASIELYTGDRPGNFILAQSPNKKIIAVLSQKPFERLNSETIELLLLDSNLQIIGRYSWPIKEKPVNFNILDLKIGNDSSLFALIETAPGIQKYYDKTDVKRALLMDFNPNKNDIKEYEFVFPGYQLGKLKLFLDSSFVNLIGTYSKGNDNQKGVFFFQKDLNANVVYRKKIAFQNLWEKHAKIALLEIALFKYDANGRFSICLEENETKELCFTDPRTGILQCNEHFYSNNLFFLSFSKTTPKIENKVFTKRQYSFNDQGFLLSTSILEHPKTKDLVFLYNDHEKNHGILMEDELRLFERPNKANIFYWEKINTSMTKRIPLENKKLDNLLLLSIQKQSEFFSKYAVVGNTHLFKIIKLKTD